MNEPLLQYHQGRFDNPHRITKEQLGITDDMLAVHGEAAVTITMAAVDMLPQYSVATVTGKLGDSSSLAFYGKVIGVAQTTISPGFSGEIQVFGLIVNPLWTWTPGAAVFLNGSSLSQTAPSAGFLQQIGIAKNSQTLFIDVTAPILL
jgi:hypothetical protein